MAEIWHHRTRKYGRLKYGRNTYDKFRGANWQAISPVGSEIWTPVSGPVVPPAPWISAADPKPEIWVPIVEPTSSWDPT